MKSISCPIVWWKITTGSIVVVVVVVDAAVDVVADVVRSAIISSSTLELLELSAIFVGDHWWRFGWSWSWSWGCLLRCVYRQSDCASKEMAGILGEIHKVRYETHHSNITLRVSRMTNYSNIRG